MNEMHEIERAWMRNKEQRVPEHTLHDLIAYRDKGVPPGDFLSQVLTNNFIGAFKSGDDLNIANMYAIACYLYNSMPIDSWGSAEKVTMWLKKFNPTDQDEHP